MVQLKSKIYNSLIYIEKASTWYKDICAFVKNCTKKINYLENRFH